MDAVTAFTRAVETFRKVFGGEPAMVVSAPGRVNLIGEHTDYNDGFVLPMAIEQRTVIAAGPGTGQKAVVHSAAFGETATIDLSTDIRPGLPAWTNHLRGVLFLYARLKHGVPAFRAVIESDVPIGGGLASSAALEVATATLVEQLTRCRLNSVEKAQLCQQAERDFAGVPTGIMDQLTAVAAKEGRALLVDCRLLSTEQVPISDPAVTVLVVNTTVRHDLASGAYARRREECEEAARVLTVSSLRDATIQMLAPHASSPGAWVRRARHVISENARTLLAAKLLRERDWPAVGALMYASHASLRDDYQVSSAELDAVVEIARGLGEAGGVFGCRMTGGGFGGSAIALVQSRAVETLMTTIAEQYTARTGLTAEMFSTRAAGGASVTPHVGRTS